jgi:hypothetical protein
MFLILTVCVMSMTAAHAQFNMSVNSPLTIPTEQYAPATVTLTSGTDNWSGTVVVTCGSLPAYASCIFPNAIQSFAVSASTPTTATIYINTSEIYKYQSKAQPSSIQGRMEGVALCSLFTPALCFLFMSGKRRKRAAGLMLFTLAMLPLAGLTGCTSIRPPSTPPGTYNIAISAYSNNFATTSVLQLVVTP